MGRPKGYIKLNYQEKMILKILSNKRGQKPSTIESKMGIRGNLMHPALRRLVNLELVKRRQIPIKITSRSVSRKTKTQYFITEEGLKEL